MNRGSRDSSPRYYWLAEDSSEQGKKSRTSTVFTKPDKSDPTQAIQIMTRNYKVAINRNRLKLLIILNFLPLLAILYTLWEYQWYQVRNDNFFVYWLNFTTIGQISKGPIQESQAHSILLFKAYGCNNNLQLCNTLYPFAFAGVVSFALTCLGVLAHILNMVQITWMVKGKKNCMKGYITPGQLQLITFFLYVTAICYWFIATGLIEAVSNFKRFISSVGLPVLVYVLSVAMYLALMTYFRFVFSKGRKNAMVNKLLHAERELLRECQGESEIVSP